MLSVQGGETALDFSWNVIWTTHNKDPL